MLTHELCSSKTRTSQNTTKSFVLQTAQPYAFAAQTLDSFYQLFTHD